MKQLLLVIDIQEGWRHKVATEAAMLRAVELCKVFEGDIIHCCFRNEPQTLFQTELHWHRFEATYDTDEFPEIAPLQLPKYWRSTYSCITDETLPIVRQYDRVYIAGVYTDISVYATALHLFDLGIPVSVVTDCVATLHGQHAHQSSLSSLAFAIGGKNMVEAQEIAPLSPSTSQ